MNYYSAYQWEITHTSLRTITVPTSVKSHPHPRELLRCLPVLNHTLTHIHAHTHGAIITVSTSVKSHPHPRELLHCLQVLNHIHIHTLTHTHTHTHTHGNYYSAYQYEITLTPTGTITVPTSVKSHTHTCCCFFLVFSSFILMFNLNLMITKLHRKWLEYQLIIQ